MRIQHDPAMRPFLDLLRNRREKCRDVCESTTGDIAARAGGRAQELKDILDLIETASSRLEKLVRPGQVARSPNRSSP